MNYQEIYPSIFVYKDVVDDIEKLYDLVVKSESFSNGSYIFKEWVKWFVFGTFCSTTEDLNIEDLKSKFSDNEVFKNELFIHDEILKSTTQCINHYCKINNVNRPDGSFITSPNIAKYIRREWLDEDELYKMYPAQNDAKELVMQFHTDYEMGKWFTKTRQFLLTANFYINDDYDGGEVFFLHKGNIIPYKPKMGDLIVFPSGSPLYPEYPMRDPYFHGVGTVRGGEKYFSRSYVQYETDYDDYWYKLRDSFSSEEDFNKRLEEIYRGGHNIVGVYAGKDPFDIEETTHNMGLSLLEQENIWIVASENVKLLYDTNDKNMYFKDSDGNLYQA